MYIHIQIQIQFQIMPSRDANLRAQQAGPAGTRGQTETQTSEFPITIKTYP